MTPDAIALAKQVLVLDETGTPGPWRRSNGGLGVLADHFEASGFVCRVERITPVNDAALIATYRTAAPLLASALLEAHAQIEKLQGAVLRPLSPLEVEQALHQGRAEAMAATGDNAWTSLLKQRDEAHRELEEMRAARDVACDLAESIYDGGNAHGFVTNYTGPLRAVGAKP